MEIEIHNNKLVGDMKKILAVVMLVGVFTFGYSQSRYYYDDYRRSITDINWQTIVADLVLTPRQKDQLFALNNRYPSYDSWNVVYVNHPDRWRNDRYVEIERILGPVKYKKFKHKYYRGRNPVVVYHNSHHYKQPRKKVYVVESRHGHRDRHDHHYDRGHGKHKHGKHGHKHGKGRD